VFVLELTHDMNVLPALLVASATALCVTVLLLRRSILTEKLARRGQHIAREYSVDVFDVMRVSDVMDPKAPTILESTPVSVLSDRIAKGDPDLAKRQATLVVDPSGNLVGIITRGDIVKALSEGTAKTKTVLQAAGKELEVAYPDETLQSAIGKMLKREVGRLPVVEHSSERRILGYIGRADILAARMKIHEEEELRERGPIMGGPPARD
jgi:CBS domain-containing protein